MARGGYNYFLCGDATFTPWTISPGKKDNATDKDFLVEPGVCFSRYSLDTGSFVPIKGLNKDFTVTSSEDKFFIQFDLLSNLQVSGAQIKCEHVGKDAPDDGWKTYPEFYEITPQDEFSTDGRVTKIRDGKRQTKCFALIGYQTEDPYKNSTGGTSSSSSSSSSAASSSSSAAGGQKLDAIDWIQILDQTLILAATIVSGVPCVIPFPYLNAGYNHLASLVDIDEFKS
jgi:hypothetical protein